MSWTFAALCFPFVLIFYCVAMIVIILQLSSNNRSTAIKKPKPRKDAVKEVPATPTFESASDIRNYIYKEWMEKKQASGKKSISEKRRQEKEEQQKKEKV